MTTVGVTMGFFKPYLVDLINKKHTVELAYNNSWDVPQVIRVLKLKTYLLPFSRNPCSLDNLKAYKQLKKIVEENQYDIVHCHTPVAAFITRMACRNIRKNGTKVVYTAHGFHFYKGAHLKNWMVYFPIECLCAHWTDVLITINREDYKFAQTKMKQSRVEYVPGVGIDVEKYKALTVDVSKKREELGIPKDAVLLLSVGELNKNKNHETVIRAIEGMGVYYIIAGKGKRENKLREIAKKVGLGNNLRLLGYRNDISELLNIADVFVFPSYREGLSVSLMEAMASGKPIVASMIRGNVDLIDKDGGFLFDPHSIKQCKEAIHSILHSDMHVYGLHNQKKIREFSTDVVLTRINKIYGDLICPRL